MSIFQRTILIIASLVLLFMSLPYLLFENIHTHISQTQIIWYVVLSSIIAIYNFFIIYKEATTIHVVLISEENLEKVEK